MLQLLQKMSQHFFKDSPKEFDEFRVVIEALSKMEQGALGIEGEMSIKSDHGTVKENCYGFSRSLEEAYFSIPNQNLYYAKKKFQLYKILNGEIVQISSDEWLKPILGGHLNLNDFLHFKNLLIDFDAYLLGDENVEGRMATKWSLMPKGNGDSGWSKINLWFNGKSKKLLRLDFYDSHLDFQRRIDLDEKFNDQPSSFEKMIIPNFTARNRLESQWFTRFSVNKIKLYKDEIYKNSEGYNLIWDKL